VKCLVIDTSILQAAGRRGATNLAIHSKQCRDFLTEVVERTDYRIAFSRQLSMEWSRRDPQSATGRDFLRDMIRADRVFVPRHASNLPLKRALDACTNDDGVRAKMQKDRHLIEAALEADLIVLAHNDRDRFHFAAACASVDSLRAILWSNPADPAETCRAWIAAGAPRETPRLLYAYRHPERMGR
jgi:hypothetical protein